MFCASCSPGYYQDAVGQTSCNPCPRGYYSSDRKDRCERCPTDTYSPGDGTQCQPCTSIAECPCMAPTSPCFSSELCHNLGNGNHECDTCPEGYMGNGVTCTDINEVKDKWQVKYLILAIIVHVFFNFFCFVFWFAVVHLFIFFHCFKPKNQLANMPLLPG